MEKPQIKANGNNKEDGGLLYNQLRKLISIVVSILATLFIASKSLLNVTFVRMN